jgi:hypothetical protein
LHWLSEVQALMQLDAPLQNVRPHSLPGSVLPAKVTQVLLLAQVAKTGELHRGKSLALQEADFEIRALAAQEEQHIHEPTRMPQVSDRPICRICGIELIPSTDEAWDTRQLGADERYVKRATPEQEAAINKAALIVEQQISVMPPRRTDDEVWCVEFHGRQREDKDLHTAVRAVATKTGEGK